MTLFRIGLLAVVLCTMGAVASNAEPRGPFCFTPNNPPRIHSPYERVNRWEWDNRSQS